MRLVMMGTGPFAVPTFRELLVTHHTIAALVTGPVRHRPGKLVPATPMRDLAHAHGVRVFDPEDINAPRRPGRIGRLGSRFAGRV